MKRKYAAILVILGSLVTVPTGALADGSDNGDDKGEGLRICVPDGHGGRKAPEVEVKKFKVGPRGLRAWRVTATPREGRALGPVDVSLNAQVAVLQAVVQTNQPAVLDGVNVDITQGNSPAPQGNGTQDPGTTAPPTDTGTSPGAPGAPPAGDPPADPATAPSGVTVNVNAQVAVIQVVVGSGNMADLKNVNVVINQGNQVAPPS